MKSGLYTLLNRVSDFTFGFFIFLILVRILTKDEFGTWVLYISVSTLVEMTRSTFVQSAFVKFSVASDEKEYNEILSASFILNVIITLALIVLLASLAGILSSIWKTPELANIIYVYTMVTFSYIFFTQFIVIMQAKFNFKGIFYSQLLRTGGFFLFIFAFWLLQIKIQLIYLVFSQLVFAVLASGLSYLFVKKHFKIMFRPNWDWVKKLFHYSKYVFGTTMISNVSNSMDKFLLGGILNTAEVAIFNTATRILNLIDVPLFTISTIVFPKSAERIKNEGPKAVKYLYERSIGLILAMAIPFTIVCFLFAEQIILIIAGKEYIDAVPILRIVIFLSILKPFDRQSGSFLDVIGKPNINFITVLINFGVAVIILYIMLTYFGVLGAAYGILISTFIGIVVTHIILNKLLNINPFNTFIYALQFYTDGMKQIKTKLTNNNKT